MPTLDRYANLTINQPLYDEVKETLPFCDVADFAQDAIREKLDRMNVVQIITGKKQKFEPFKVTLNIGGRDVTYTNRDMLAVAISMQQEMKHDPALLEDVVTAWILYTFAEQVTKQPASKTTKKPEVVTA